MGLGLGTRAFGEQRTDFPSLVEMTEGRSLKAKTVFFPAGADPDTQAGTEKEAVKNA